MENKEVKIKVKIRYTGDGIHDFHFDARIVVNFVYHKVRSCDYVL